MKKIKKEIKQENIVIKLYEISHADADHFPISNIEAFDNDGNLLWTAEQPTNSVFYYNMQFDENNETLEVDSGAGQIYILDIKTGCILRSYLVK